MAAADGASSAVAAADRVVVHADQHGNPLLKYLKNWAFGDTAADYQVEQHTAILFLQLRFHLLHKEYLLPRMRVIGAMPCRLHVMLCLCDVEDSANTLCEIQKLCIDHHFTLIVCWTSDEAAAYVTAFRKYANKGPDMLRGKRETNASAAALAALTQVRSVNKTDVANLLGTFGSFSRLAEQREEDLLVCPGLGEKKVKRLLAALDAPFPHARKPARRVDPASAPLPDALPRPVPPSAPTAAPPSGTGTATERSTAPGTLPAGPPEVGARRPPTPPPAAPPLLLSEKARELEERRAAVMRKGYGVMRSALRAVLDGGEEDDDPADLSVPPVLGAGEGPIRSVDDAGGAAIDPGVVAEAAPPGPRES